MKLGRPIYVRFGKPETQIEHQSTSGLQWITKVLYTVTETHCNIQIQTYTRNIW